MSIEALWSTMSPDLIEALDAWINEQPDPRPNRTGAVEMAWRGWLTGSGLLPLPDEAEKLN